MRPPTERFAAQRAWFGRSIYGSGYRKMRELDLDLHALALCAQQVLCTAPLIVAISAVLQRVTGDDVSVYIVRFFGLHGDAATAVSGQFGRTSSSVSTPALVFALITAVVFCAGVGAVHQRVFEMIWLLPRVIAVRNYLRQLLWALGFSVFAVAIFGAGRLGRVVNHAFAHGSGPWAGIVLQGLLTFLFYWWSLHWLLGGRVAARKLLPGALAIGVATTVMVWVSRAIVPGQITWQVHAYGLIGAVFVLSVWLMVLSTVVFGAVLFGALFVQRRAAPARDAIAETPELLNSD